MKINPFLSADTRLILVLCKQKGLCFGDTQRAAVCISDMSLVLSPDICHFQTTTVA